MQVPRAAVLFAVALLVATSISIYSMAGSGPVRLPDRQPPAPWTHLPPALARRLHFTTAELPGIPVEADSLRDIRHWPATMVFDGVRYRLVTRRGHFDISGPVDPDVPDPGGYYQANYVHPERPRDRMGPYYVWLVDSTLVERSYRTASGTRSFGYDAKGTLRQFLVGTPWPPSWFSCERGPRGTGLQERFGIRGQLVGFQMDDMQYWRGVERTRDDYFEIWQRWFRTLPTQGRPLPPKSSASTTWDDVPEELRPLMHVTASELPQFPRWGESLDDPRRWPATWLVDGQVYRLFYVEYGDRKTREGLHHFQDIRSPNSYGAYYSPDGRRDYRVSRGPAYAWQADGTLGRREYRSDAINRTWIYDEEGKLLTYGSRAASKARGLGCARRRELGALIADEWYSRDGALVGYVSQVEQESYWKGHKLAPRAYADSCIRWYRERNPFHGPYRM